MRRYKGRASAKTIGFPYVVEILVPLGGLGKQLNAMHKFHTQRGMLVLCRPRDLGRAVVMAGREAQDR